MSDLSLVFDEGAAADVRQGEVDDNIQDQPDNLNSAAHMLQYEVRDIQQMVLIHQAPSDFSVDSLSFKRATYRGGCVNDGAASQDLEMLVEVLGESINSAANDDNGVGASRRSLNSSLNQLNEGEGTSFNPRS